MDRSNSGHLGYFIMVTTAHINAIKVCAEQTPLYILLFWVLHFCYSIRLKMCFMHVKGQYMYVFVHKRTICIPLRHGIIFLIYQGHYICIHQRTMHIIHRNHEPWKCIPIHKGQDMPYTLGDKYSFRHKMTICPCAQGTSPYTPEANI